MEHTHICFHLGVSVFDACSGEVEIFLIIPLLKCKLVHEEMNYLYDREV